ncbi:MAG: type II toxin-antitoxin system PemK/MazF family toxin [Actinomycetota bacterium]
MAAITSHVPANTLELEIILEPIETTGLVKRSLLRLDFLMTIPEELISRKIGRLLPENLMTEVEHKLKQLFGINST